LYVITVLLMSTSSRPFCELYVKKILPAIRAYIACVLVKKCNYSQLKASKILGIRQPAVNYIVTGKRGARCIAFIESNPALKNLIDEYIVELVTSELFNPCKICRKIREDATTLNTILQHLAVFEQSIS